MGHPPLHRLPATDGSRVNRQTSKWAKSVTIALWLVIALRPVPGQNLSFLREFAQYSNPASVAVDATGIYSLRLTDQRAGNQIVSLVKHDTAGAQLWIRTFLTSPISFAGGVTATPQGIYVTGTGVSSPSNAGNWDIFVAGFSTAGGLLWTRQINLPRSDFARGVAADDSGLYVIGQQQREGVIRKYDPSGVERWTVELDAPEDGYHAPLGITVDTTGVYVAGVIQPTGQGTAGFLRKYDANGAQIWERQFGHIVRGVAVDSSGVYVAGWSATPLDGATGSGSNFLRKYDSGGTEVWTRHLGDVMEPGGVNDLGITAEPGGVYVVGGTRGQVSGHCRQGGQDALLRKFDSNGSELWSRQFGTHENDYARTVALDATGVYVAGDSFLAKFEKTTAAADASRPRIAWGCVVNAASHLGGGVAPGEIVTIFGSRIGPPQLVSQRITGEGLLATELAETRILFNSVPAPLLHVSESQSSAVVPYGVAGLSSVNVQLEYRGERSAVITVPVLPARPGIFTQGGMQAAAVNEDGSVNSVSNPAPRGSVITLFATGEGLTSPRLPDGMILGNALPRPASEVYVYFSVSEDDWPVAGEVLSLNGVTGAVVGLLQIRVRVPRDTAANDALPVSLGVRFQDLPIGSQTVTVAVR